MGRNEEDFAKGMGYKVSQIPMRSNKFRNKCVDCGRNVFAGEGTMVKGEEHDKIKTVCIVCNKHWTSKEFMDNPLMFREMKMQHLNGLKPLEDK
jgi:hypothetical protein